MDALVPLVPWHAHATTVLVVHLVWSTRNRVPWLQLRFDAWLAALLERKARALDCRLVAAGNAADHVHVLVCHPPRISVAQIAHRLKGASSRAIHLALPQTQGLVWQVGYWAESVTPIALEPLVAYVQRQRVHHSDDALAEPWEANRH
jgi:REP element-mobilizing transposase RayT